MVYNIIKEIVEIIVADPGSGSGMNNPDHIFESLKPFFGLKYFKSFMRIRDG
jgi:hypothetical protein